MLRGVRRVELVVVGAMVLSTPTILQAFSGGITLTSALVRLAGALALCWAVGAIVERTLDSYARQARQKELAERIEQLRVAQPGRAGPSDQTGAFAAIPVRVDDEATTAVRPTSGEVTPFQ